MSCKGINSWARNNIFYLQSLKFTFLLIKPSQANITNKVHKNNSQKS